MFRETGTLGVRRWPASRHKLERRTHTVDTDWGPVDGKLAVLGDGSQCFSPEYEACKKVAVANDLPLNTVYEAVRRAFTPPE